MAGKHRLTLDYYTGDEQLRVLCHNGDLLDTGKGETVASVGRPIAVGNPWNYNKVKTR